MTTDQLLPANLRRAFSPHLGMVRYVHESTVEAGLPPLVNVAVSTSRTAPVTGAEVNGRPGSCHFSRSQAWCAAIGETVERFSAAYVPPGEVALATAAQLGEGAVDVEALALYRVSPPAGSGYCNPTRETLLGWCEGRRLLDGATRALPAQMVYLGYHPAPGEPRLGLFTSSGLCCERSLPAAVLGGVLEQIERDATMLTWRLALSLPKLDWRTDPELTRIATLMRGVRPELTLLDASSLLGIPVVLSVLRDPHATFPIGLVVGGSAGLTAAQAAQSAFREVFQTLVMASLIARNAGADGAAETFDEHVGRFIAADVARRADFLTAGTETVAASTLPQIVADTPLGAVQAVAQRLDEHGVQALAFDLTTSDAAGLGLHVARAFCPELVWLDVDFEYPFDGRPRLDAVARERGLALDADGHAVLNPEPHPFP